ncbi:hypothetical protein DFA_12025 [Cavenderia fasciculata]|uniref:Uncharacterized protein n=1 Tax=Cavenderia fasciculata TaxID=261658 RepID=F4QFF4_CACFS|nr:uncharacterized protein DFA_12025 [Cavenderia fasciculata]EGG14255.1 hypothetical protein DFA_12025 [Cavenderia fasciculata]|eukprot:XP_004350964.1 hypothetical protein DFA_12025 [Cavenderia fasciculata]
MEKSENYLAIVYEFLYYLSIFLLYFIDPKLEKQWDNVYKLEIKVPSKYKGSIFELEKYFESQLEERVKDFSTGSVLLIQNGSERASSMVRAITAARMSHCAIYLDPSFASAELIPNLSPTLLNRPLLWQAAGEKQSSEYGYKSEGPDLHSMARFLAYYVTVYPKSRFVLRPLKQQMSSANIETIKQFVAKSADQQKQLFCSNIQLTWIHHTALKPFRFLQFLDHLFISENKNRDDYTFCSKLVAETYKHVDIIPKDIDSNAFNPSHFSMPNMTDIFSTKETEIVFNYV